MFRFAFLILILNSAFFLFGQKGTIEIGTTDLVKNLNPYMAESQMEINLKDLVFPGLIANFRKARESDADDCDFKPLLLDHFDCRSGLSDHYLSFRLDRRGPSFNNIQDNFSKLKTLGTRTNFSWNLDRIELNQENPGHFFMYFDITNQNSKMIAASFPIVNFDTAEKWDKIDETFNLNRHRKKLKGFSDYEYEEIDLLKRIYTLAPKKGAGKRLKVKYFPDYSEMINSLKDQSLKIAFNISPLTVLSDDFQRAEINFADQFVTFVRVTERGKKKGLGNMDLIKKIRADFQLAFYQSNLLSRESVENRSLYAKTGFFTEDAGMATSPLKIPSSVKLTLLYDKSTVNDEFVRILEGAFNSAGYRLSGTNIARGVDRSKIESKKYDLVMETRYVLFPEFLNLKYYQDLLENHDQGTTFRKRINRILARDESTSKLFDRAQKLEADLLEVLPVIFLARYNTDIVLQPGVRNYGAGQSPYFFYNLKNW